MPRRLCQWQELRRIFRLLPACERDISLAKREFKWLKEHVSPSALQNQRRLNPTELRRFEDHIKDRVKYRKPLQYILGTQPFGDLEIVTRPPVLIPRWETEEWVHRLIDKLSKEHRPLPNSDPFRILDLCTGSGCIALALGASLRHVEVVATDVSEEALALAQHNHERHAGRLLSPVTFHKLDIFHDDHAALKPFDLIVSNPPYITVSEYATLDPEVREWEDRRALVADQEGTAVHRRIIELSRILLRGKNDPCLVMEIGGQHQVPVLKDLLQRNRFQRVDVWKDLAGKDRVVVASRHG